MSLSQCEYKVYDVMTCWGRHIHTMDTLIHIMVALEFGRIWSSNLWTKRMEIAVSVTAGNLNSVARRRGLIVEGSSLAQYEYNWIVCCIKSIRECAGKVELWRLCSSEVVFCRFDGTFKSKALSRTVFSAFSIYLRTCLCFSPLGNLPSIFFILLSGLHSCAFFCWKER